MGRQSSTAPSNDAEGSIPPERGSLASSSSSSSIGAYSYFSKQQELLRLISDTRQLLRSIISDHRDERFPLGYPRFHRTDEDGDWHEAERGGGRSRSPTGRPATSFHSRSSSGKGGRSRFQLLGLGGGTVSSPLPSLAPSSLSPMYAAAAGGLDLSVLDESSLGRLLTGRMEECAEYLERMATRVRDRSSRVLVTGDVNGGKSTLINALLGRTDHLLPVDQQPCTQAFCEVIPSPDVPEPQVHAIPEYDRYNPDDPTTYDVMSVARMQSSVQEVDSSYQWYRLSLPIRPAPSHDDDGGGSPLLTSNDLVRISLIDSPGLNSDLFKTMNLFARQEEIDVVLFVVNAANHLTLSAREFLETAGRDKAYIFVVVNKFDDIRNREKCRRIILGQIGEVLPATASEAADLVHFVSARDHLAGRSREPAHRPHPLPSLPSPPWEEKTPGEPGLSAADPETPGDREFQQQQHFARLQSCLSDFILSKRTKSKLLPAKTYLTSLLSDLSGLFEYNERQCQGALGTVRREIDLLAPCYEELVKREGPLRQDLLHGVTAASDDIYKRALTVLSPPALLPRLQGIMEGVPWRGVFAVFRWRRQALEAISQEAERAIGEARLAATDALSTGLVYLQTAASSHAASVYGGSHPRLSQGAAVFCGDALSPPSSLFPALEEGDFAAPASRPWEVAEWIGYGVVRGGSLPGTMLRVLGSGAGAATLLPLFLGGPRVHLPLLLHYHSVVFGRLASHSASVSRSSVSAMALATGATVATAVLTVAVAAVLYWLGDVERAARRLLLARLSLHYGHPAWSHRLAHSIESACHQQLLGVSGSLLARFQEALAGQRRLRAEKDLCRAQLSARLDHIVGRSRAISVLQERTVALQLLQP